MDVEILKQVLKLPKMGRGQLMDFFEIGESEARAYAAIKENHGVIKEAMTDNELVVASQKLASQKQKHMDISRIERKAWRQEIRLWNHIEAQNDELINLLKMHSFKIKTKEHKANKDSAWGMIQLSDLHGNELVNLDCNKYDFDVMSKRVRKFIHTATKDFLADGITDVFVPLTGDMLNSDRRDDEKMAMATNRTNAQFLVAEVLINALLELNKNFNIVVSSVDGNESRVNKDCGFEELVATDTYDSSIYNIVRRLLKDKPGITFDGRCGAKKVVSINGQNILLIHAHQGFGKDPHNAVTKLVAQYAKRGIVIRFVILGHIHEAYISEMFARSSSTVGANAYSEDGLNLTSRASQNYYKIYKDGSINGTMVDLQEIEGYEGYDIQEELKMYNAKSASKLKPVSVFEAVIDKLH
jgi:predicted phosphodiesterase